MSDVNTAVERVKQHLERVGYFSVSADRSDELLADYAEILTELETVKAAFSDALIALGEFDPETANRLSQRWFDVKGIT